VGFQEIEFRSCFEDIWVGRGGIDVVKSCAKRRLERKISFDWDRQQRFEEDAKGFQRNKKLASGANREVQ
jgi:hypothetical protein